MAHRQSVIQRGAVVDKHVVANFGYALLRVGGTHHDVNLRQRQSRVRHLHRTVNIVQCHGIVAHIHSVRLGDDLERKQRLVVRYQRHDMPEGITRTVALQLYIPLVPRQRREIIVDIHILYYILAH